MGDWSVTEELAESLVAAGRFDDLVMLVHHLVDHGDRAAPVLLARLLAAPEFVERAADMLTERADAGDGEAAEGLAELLAQQGRLDQLLWRANMGDLCSAMRSADMLIERGHTDEAIRVLRTHSEAFRVTV